MLPEKNVEHTTCNVQLFKASSMFCDCSFCFSGVQRESSVMLMPVNGSHFFYFLAKRGFYTTGALAPVCLDTRQAGHKLRV